MPNGTYGGVRGRETKVIGGKLQESFVFLLLDLRGSFAKRSRATLYASDEVRVTPNNSEVAATIAKLLPLSSSDASLTVTCCH